MSQNLEKRVITLLSSILIVAVVAVSLWAGFAMGRSSEKQRLHKVIERQSRNDGTTNIDEREYAREMAALEQHMAGDDKMMQTIAFMRNYYVDPIKLEDIYEKAIPALLSELDPHSEYIPAKMFSQVNESLEGEFDGIGIVFNASTDTITVLSVIPQGPSSEAGVRPGDRIVKIDGRVVAGQKIPQDSMVKLMRGKRGTRVELGVKRGSLDELVDIEVTRAPIEIHSIETAFMLDHSANWCFDCLSKVKRIGISNTAYDG